MLFESIGNVYIIDYQDEGQIRSPLQIMLSGEMDELWVRILAHDLKKSSFFQGYYDNPEPPVTMNVIRIVQISTSKEIPPILPPTAPQPTEEQDEDPEGEIPGQLALDFQEDEVPEDLSQDLTEK